MSESKQRLFVRVKGTEGNFVYCGGPNVNEMVDHVGNLLQSCAEPLVEEALEQLNNPPKPKFLKRLVNRIRGISSQFIYADYLMIQTRMMTDSEVAAIGYHTYTETPIAVRTGLFDK